MTGQKLHEKYTDLAITLQNCGTDTWDQLTLDERILWDALAEAINLGHV